jgi:ribosomal protein L11 methylase PrmA
VHNGNPAQTDVVTANLYSELLIGILPKLRGGAWLILSGILRSQQDELVHALQRNALDVIRIKHRGKWVAILARRGSALQPPNLELANFCDGDRPPLQ